jgi:hypothetical protein
MRWRVMTAVGAALTACGSESGDAPAKPATAPAPKTPAVVIDAPAPAPPDPGLAHHDAKDAGAAVQYIIESTHPRVIGFGEVHAMAGGPKVASSLAHFTREVLPAISDQLSDLVLETWVVDKSCGAKGSAATAAVEGELHHPQSTKSDLANVVDALRAAKVQPRAMHLSCDDYARVAPPGKPVAIEAMLDVVTRELGQGAVDAAAARDKDPHARPIVATYGGSLHNELYPRAGLEGWSFAKKVDDATGGRYVEIDLIVPEYAAADGAAKKEAWYPMLSLAAPDHVVVIDRAPRSYVVLLPTGVAQ